jgi:hypothetical protein
VRPVVALLVLLAALVAAPVGAQDERKRTKRTLDRVSAAFAEGEAMGFQLVFEELETAHDLDINTIVESMREKEGAEGRAVVITTASYERDGKRHRFVFGMLDGALRLFDLQVKKGDDWEAVPQDVFWFQINDDPPPPDLLPDGDVVLTARGWCNEGRGSTVRPRAVVVLRSYHSADGRPPAY